MGPLFLNRISQGPTMILPPFQSHPSFRFASQPILDTVYHGLPACAANHDPFSMDGIRPGPSNPRMGHSSWAPASSSNPVCTNLSRKRTREESILTPNEQPTPRLTSLPKEGDLYGEGMVLLNPRSKMAISAESQTTWLKEAEREAVADTLISSGSDPRPISKSPVPPSRKARRLDTTAPGLGDIAFASIQHRLKHASDDHRRSLNANSSISAPFAPGEPLVDDFTQLLGISWQRVSHNDDLAPAVRGWEKYINNHFSRCLQSAHILLKNRSMNAYLVTARPIMGSVTALPEDGASSSLCISSKATCFYLFKEDLSEARLVGSTWDNCLQNLRSSPIAFEVVNIIKPTEKSREVIAECNAVLVNAMGNGISVVADFKNDSVNVQETDLNSEVCSGMDIDI
ncbi:hypothetical protein Egran_01174 [Elaphomyces granulatus]|uniref:Uncharacterized protein n=1 Tax=Elaphomyces granulatus TaxID=519963 RepID=A0A232M4R4_9EURO|nr:hypothetical protein Egran_01174 [Elaphomyces granulatus]